MTILRSVASPFGRILLITSDSEYLRERTRSRALAAVKEAEPDVQVTVASASGITGAELVALTSPSLFSDRIAVVVTDVEAAVDDAAAVLLEYAAESSPDIAMILIHGGSQKGRKLLETLRTSAHVDDVAVTAPKYDNQLIAWVRSEARDLGRAIDDPAASLLVTAVGADLRSLAAAIDQLAAFTERGEGLTVELVSKYFGGRAQVKGFEIADHALAGHIPAALEALRWAEEARLSPVAVTSSIAMGLRQLAQVATSDGGSDGDLAKRFGIPPFKVKSLRTTARSWTERGLAAAIAAVAKADLDVKGQAAVPGWVVERLVVDIARARELR